MHNTLVQLWARDPRGQGPKKGAGPVPGPGPKSVVHAQEISCVYTRDSFVYAKLCETMRNYATLCETMRNYAKICETMQNYAELLNFYGCIFTIVCLLLYFYYCSFTIVFLLLYFYGPPSQNQAGPAQDPWPPKPKPSLSGPGPLAHTGINRQYNRQYNSQLKNKRGFWKIAFLIKSKTK